MNQDQKIVSVYFKLLRELRNLKLSYPPELILPAPKEELRQILARCEHPAKTWLLEGLEYFKPEGKYGLEFLTKLLSRTLTAAVAASIAIIIDGGSWLWILGAGLGAIGGCTASFKFLVREDWWSQASQRKRWGWAFATTFADYVFGLCCGALWFRLVVVSGLYGLYSSMWVRFSIRGVILALSSLYIGYFLSIYMNTILFFIMDWRRREFKRAR
jgi:hypothetical protein